MSAGSCGPNRSPSRIGSSNAAQLQMVQQDLEIVRIDVCVLGRAVEEVLGMLDDVLVERRAGGHQYGETGCLPPAGAARPLPRRCDRSRISGHHHRVERADVHAQFQRVRCDDGADLAFPQFLLDLAPLARQIAAPIPADRVGRHGAALARVLQIGDQNFGRQPVVGRTRASAGHGPGTRCDAARLLQIAAPDPELPVHNRRIVEDDKLLACRCAVALYQLEWLAPLSASASSCGLAIVAELQMNCGFDP